MSNDMVTVTLDKKVKLVPRSHDTAQTLREVLGVPEDRGLARGSRGGQVGAYESVEVGAGEKFTTTPVRDFNVDHASGIERLSRQIAKNSQAGLEALEVLAVLSAAVDGLQTQVEELRAEVAELKRGR